MKQTLINNWFPNYTADEQIKRTIRNVSQQNKHCNSPTNKQKNIKLFLRHYNYKLIENILKTLIKINILPTDPNKKIKVIIYYNKFKTSNQVIPPPRLGFCKKLTFYINLNVP